MPFRGRISVRKRITPRGRGAHKWGRALRGRREKPVKGHGLKYEGREWKHLVVDEDTQQKGEGEHGRELRTKRRKNTKRGKNMELFHEFSFSKRGIPGRRERTGKLRRQERIWEETESRSSDSYYAGKGAT